MGTRKKILTPIAALCAVAGLGLVHAKLREPVRPTIEPAVDAETTVDHLEPLLRSTGVAAEQISVVRAFADVNRPAEGCRVWRSEDGRIVIVVGANGRAGHRDGYDAVLPSIPSGCAQVILVGGNGMSVGLLGSGGRGGVCRMESPAGLAAAGVGGNGGEGIFGGNGGRAGGGRGSASSILGVVAFGGDGGPGVLTGGAGGDAGDARGDLPPGEPGVFAICGHGGRGLFGGDGGGR